MTGLAEPPSAAGAGAGAVGPPEPLPSDADLASVPLERLEGEVTSLAAHLAAAEARFLQVLGVFDAREGWAGWGVRSCAQWLAWRVGLSPGASRERVRVARALPVLPTIQAAFAAGRLSYSQVRALTRVATPADEEQLATWALQCPAWQLERLLRGVRTVRAQQADARAAVQAEQRRVTWRYDDDGTLLLSARLPPAEGAALVATLEHLADSLLRDGHDPSPDAETDVDADADEPGPGQAQPSSLRPAAVGPGLAERLRERGGWAALHADALLWLTDAAANLGVADRIPSALVQVHVDATVLDDPAADGQCRIDDGPALAVATVRRMICEGQVQGLGDDPDGNPLRLGRTRRAPNRAQRRALWRRDGGCVYPGCGARLFVDAHHVIFWSDGGLTDLDNLVLLCRRHHVAVHEGGFTLTMPTPGNVRVHDPDGRPVPVVPDRPDGDAAPIRDGALTWARPAVDALEPDWYGDRLDLDATLAALPQPEPVA